MIFLYFYYFYDIISSYICTFIRIFSGFVMSSIQIFKYDSYTALYMEAHQFTWDLSNLNDIKGRNSTRRAVPLTCLCFYLIRRYLRKNY